jgi:hypothetical protein
MQIGHKEHKGKPERVSTLFVLFVLFVFFVATASFFFCGGSGHPPAPPLSAGAFHLRPSASSAVSNPAASG